MGLRQVEELLLALAKTLTEGPAVAEGDPALDDLEAGVTRVFPGVKKRHNPTTTIINVHHHEVQERHCDQADTGEVT